MCGGQIAARVLFLVLLSLETHFMAEYEINFGESSMQRRRCIFLCLGEMFCKYLLGPFGFNVSYLQHFSVQFLFG